MTEPEIKKTAPQARQGEKGKPILAVLVVSIALIVVGFMAVGFFNAEGDMASIGAIEMDGETATN